MNIPADHKAIIRILLIFPLWGRSLLAIGLGVLLSLATLSSAYAADTITVEYQALGRSISVSSLEAFVEQGTIDKNLNYYLSRISPETREQLRTGLGRKIQVDTLTNNQVNIVSLAQFLYDPMGERLLKYTGQFIQTFGRDNGWQSLRGALISAVADPEGFSVLQALENFPTGTIRLKLDLAVANWKRVKAAADETLAKISALKELSAEAAANDPVVDIATLPNLTQPGPFPVASQELTLQDRDRNRTFPADIYYPKDVTAVSSSLPVIVLSHGLGDTPKRFGEFAELLASYGFLVALPEHIGSNITQKEDLLAMRSNEAFKVNEFIDRPLDISFLLDELDRLNSTEFQGKLDLDQVGVMGHSFGGYTALALAGATVEFETLNRECSPDANVVGNLALLLECRALELIAVPDAVQQLTDQSLRDERVKLVLVFAPVSGLFGQTGMSQIKIPVAIMGGAYDIAAPLVPQQTSTFGWLTTPEKYLYMAEKTSHVAELTRWTVQLLNPGEDLKQSFEEGIQAFQSVLKSLFIAFPKVYLQGQEEYRPFLTSSYVEAISKQEAFPFHMIRALPEDLAQ